MFVQAVCDVRVYQSNIGESILATKVKRKFILIILVVNETQYAPDMSFFPYFLVSPIYLFIAFYLRRHIAKIPSHRSEILNRNHTRQKVRLLLVFQIAYFHFIHVFGNGRRSHASEPIAKSVE